MEVNHTQLIAAFKELDKIKGMFAKLNHTCCSSCGLAGVPDGKDWAFMHEQDMEGLESDGNAYIAFGADSGEEKDALAVGNKVVEVLKKHGLKVKWDGSTGKRIGVSI